MIPAGGLADTHGRKRIFLVGVALFMAASAACGLAGTVGWLIAAAVTGSPPALAATGLQWLSTVLLFPFAVWLISRFRDADVRFR